MIDSQDIPVGTKIKSRNGQKERRPPKKITETYLYNSALAYLQRFPASTHRFRQVMNRKIDRSCRHHTDLTREACRDMLDALVQKLTQMGLLNDPGYLKGMVSSLRRRGLSSSLITLKLSAQGLSQDDIKTALSDHAQSLDDHMNAELRAAIRYCARKRLGAFRTREPKSPDKELAALARQGYGFDMARAALEMDLDEAETILKQSG